MAPQTFGEVLNHLDDVLMGAAEPDLEETPDRVLIECARIIANLYKNLPDAIFISAVINELADRLQELRSVPGYTPRQRSLDEELEKLNFLDVDDAIILIYKPGDIDVEHD